MAKFRVRSLEELIFRKFPYVCPYCRREPHVDAVCKTVRGTELTVNHDDLRSKYKSNLSRKPKTLNGWQTMFNDIYPRNLEDHPSRSISGLFEEIGELAEAIRVFDRHPKYFVGEAADVFSYLMGFANEYSLKVGTHGELYKSFSFEDEFVKRYPGLCMQCGYGVCVCPLVPDSTVGRLAKELDLDNSDLFGFEHAAFDKTAEEAANKLLRALGGYNALALTLPFDRGQANRALISVCLKIAEGIETRNPKVAEILRDAALKLSKSENKPGTAANLEFNSLLDGISAALAKEPGVEGTLLENVGKALETHSINILLICAGPYDQDALGLQREQRAIEKAIQGSTLRDSIHLKVLPSSTTDDFRKALLKQDYDVVHFLGHADASGLIFENEDGSTNHIELKILATLIKARPVKCLVLNACSSLEKITDAIAPITVGMLDTLDDEVAIEFSRGFYEAIGEGKTYDEAVRSGETCVAFKKPSMPLPLKVLKAKPIGKVSSTMTK